MKVPGNLRIDSPSWPLLKAQVSYQGITTIAGDAFGTTLVDNLCSTAGLQPSYVGLLVKLLTGDAAGGVRQIAVHNLATGTITVAAPWTDYNGAPYQVPASTQFVILSITGGGGAPPPPPPGPGVSLWMLGVCDPGMAGSTTDLVLTNLAGFNDDLFNDEFWVQVIHNADAPATAPEREIRRVTDYVGATGTFTCDAFTVNVEANDIVAVFHESIMAIEILGFGTLDTSSATVPADSARPGLYAWEVNNYFRGCLLMTTEGAARFAPRRIVEYTNATGVFILDPNNPFPAASGNVDYVIIGDQAEFIPAVDGVNNRTPSDVIGGKADTPIYRGIFDVSSVIRYLKGTLNVKVEAYGTADAGSDADTLVDAALTQGDDYWNGMTLLMLGGANIGLARPIVDFTDVGDTMELRPAFPAAIVATDVYVILSNYHEVVPGADGAENYQPRDVIGNKQDTALYAAAANASLMRYIKGLITAGIAVPGAVSDVGPAITDFDTDLAEATDDHYNGMLLMFINGPNAGQAHTIEDYDGTNRNVVFRAGDQWTDVPVNGNSFVILPSIGGLLHAISTDIATILAAVVTEVADILADTNELQTDWADGGRLDLLIDAILLDTDTTIPALLTIIDNEIAAIEAKLDIPANFMADVTALALEASLGTHDTDIKALLATIAGYIDAEVAAIETKLDTPANFMADVSGIITSQGRQLFTMDFWSDPQEEIAIPAAAATLVFTPTVQVAERPAGATIVRVTAMLKFRMIENVYDGANALDGATVALNSQVIQVKETAAGAYVDAIKFVDNQFTLDNLAREGGDILIGSIDIAGEVDDNGNYTFRWLLRKCDSDFINMNDCQVGLRIWYSV